MRERVACRAQSRRSFLFFLLFRALSSTSQQPCSSTLFSPSRLWLSLPRCRSTPRYVRARKESGRFTDAIDTQATLIECQPAAISFSAGTAPYVHPTERAPLTLNSYFVSILPAGQPSGTPVRRSRASGRERKLTVPCSSRRLMQSSLRPSLGQSTFRPVPTCRHACHPLSRH